MRVSTQILDQGLNAMSWRLYLETSSNGFEDVNPTLCIPQPGQPLSIHTTAGSTQFHAFHLRVDQTPYIPPPGQPHSMHSTAGSTPLHTYHRRVNRTSCIPQPSQPLSIHSTTGSTPLHAFHRWLGSPTPCFPPQGGKPNSMHAFHRRLSLHSMYSTAWSTPLHAFQ